MEFGLLFMKAYLNPRSGSWPRGLIHSEEVDPRRHSYSSEVYSAQPSSVHAWYDWIGTDRASLEHFRQVLDGKSGFARRAKLRSSFYLVQFID